MTDDLNRRTSQIKFLSFTTWCEKASAAENTYVTAISLQTMVTVVRDCHDEKRKWKLRMNVQRSFSST